MTRLQAGQLGFYSQLGLGFFLLVTTFRLALGASQSPAQWAPGFLSPGVKQNSQGMKLTANLI